MSRLPEVGEYVRMFGELVGVEDVTPPPPPKQVDYLFRDTSATVEARSGGKKVQDFASFNNFYGRDTCVEHAIASAKKLWEEYGKPSDLEFVVVKVTTIHRMRPFDDRHSHIYQPEFYAFDWIRGHCGDPEPTREVVWSSKSTPYLSGKNGK